jgi:hypothetical protein
MPDFVVVLGSDNRFAVVDFSLPAGPGTVFVTPPFSGGCLVGCSGTAAAVAGFRGGEVALYDLSNPAAPVLLNVFDTGLNPSTRGLTGIGAVSLDGTSLLVGEYDGPTLVLLDVALPPAEAVLSTFTAPDFANGGVKALVLRGNQAIVSGNFNFDVIDLTIPARPSIVPYIVGVSSGRVDFRGPITCDFDGSTAVFGDATGTVYVFQVPADDFPAFLGAFTTPFEAVTSVAAMVDYIAAGSLSSGTVFILDMAPGQGGPHSSQIVIGSGQPPLPGGAVKFLGLPVLAASTNNSSGITWVNTLNPLEPSALRVASAASLAPGLRPTLGVTEFNV